MFALIAAAILVPTAASAGHLNYDLRNKSDRCVRWYIEPTIHVRGAQTHGFLAPGESYSGRVNDIHWTENPGFNYKILAQFEHCQGTHDRIKPDRYDYIPFNGTSELSMHKQSEGVYIMRHGP